MIYLEKPEDFESSFDVVSCFFEHDGEILVLHRNDGDGEHDTWAVPAGKVEAGESLADAMAREAREEISFTADPTKLTYFKKVYVKYPTYDFVYHMFHYLLPEKPEIVLSDESKAFQWLKPVDALKLNLIQDEDACIKMFYGSMLKS